MAVQPYMEWIPIKKKTAKVEQPLQGMELQKKTHKKIKAYKKSV